MPSVDWNVFHQINLKTTKINIFWFAFWNCFLRIMLDYNYVSQNNFCSSISSADLVTAIWKILLQRWVCSYFYSASSKLNVQDLHLFEWGGTKEYFAKWKCDKLPKITCYLSRTLVRAYGKPVLLEQQTILKSL